MLSWEGLIDTPAAFGPPEASIPFSEMSLGGGFPSHAGWALSLSLRPPGHGPSERSFSAP